MSTKAERGTKRTCRNPECGARFYDLNRDPILCPMCQTVFELAPLPASIGAGPAAVPEPAARASPRKVPEPDAVAAEGDEDALPAIEDEEEAAPGEEDETFLEAEEEDGSDMSNIIGGSVAENDEPQ
jgi:uncharacterized protein (TIGR02300 family)